MMRNEQLSQDSQQTTSSNDGVQRQWFVFPDFESLPRKPGNFIRTQRFECIGQSWVLSLYPGGCRRFRDGKKWVSVRLTLCSADEIRFKCRFSTKPHVSVDGKSSHLLRQWNYLGCDRFIKCYEISEHLDRGALKVSLTLQLDEERPPVCPTNTIQSDWLKFFSSENAHDVTFDVARRQFGGNEFALKICAPFLANLVKDVPRGTAIPIPDVDADIFSGPLTFVHQDCLPFSMSLKENARALLEVANKLGCASLSMSCALLKEAAIKFIVDNRSKVMESEGYSKLEESGKIMADILKACWTPPLALEDDFNIDQKDVSSLRSSLKKRGLEQDGTREVLVKRLKTCVEIRAKKSSKDT